MLAYLKARGGEAGEKMDCKFVKSRYIPIINYYQLPYYLHHRVSQSVFV